MEITKANRGKKLFGELFCGDVFYSENCGGYGIRIAAKDATSHSNAVLLADGDLVYIPNDMEVEIVNGEFVER